MIYFIFCISFSLYLFTVLFVLILLHALIFSAYCFTIVCRNKNPTGLMLHVMNIRQKKTNKNFYVHVYVGQATRSLGNGIAVKLSNDVSF